MTDHDAAYSPEESRAIAEEIIEASPSIALRVTGVNGVWTTRFITRNIAKYGYARDDFLSGRLTWDRIVHPDDLAELVNSISEYKARGVARFNTIYRIIQADGEAVWVSDDAVVTYNSDGTVRHSDSVISDYSETKRYIEKIEDHYRQQRVLKEILLGLHDSDPDRAVQIILDCAGEYLDCSRVLLFKNLADHESCRTIYEWCNSGVKQIGEFTLNYDRDIPEVRIELEARGTCVMDYGRVPERTAREFASRGVTAAAFFSIHVDNDRFGFIGFYECVAQRIWQGDTIRFLHTIAKLVAPGIQRLRNSGSVRLLDGKETAKR